VPTTASGRRVTVAIRAVTNTRLAMESVSFESQLLRAAARPAMKSPRYCGTSKNEGKPKICALMGATTQRK
jgi:hypothetical protein